MLSRALRRAQAITICISREQTATFPRTMHKNANDERPAIQPLSQIIKTKIFTDGLPPDPKYPIPADSHKADRSELGPRMVKEALYTFVRPEPAEEPELLATSPAALVDIGIDPEESQTEEFKKIVSGNKILWDEEKEEGIYPWAQCYGGYQFGNLSKT